MRLLISGVLLVSAMMGCRSKDAPTAAFRTKVEVYEAAAVEITGRLDYRVVPGSDRVFVVALEQGDLRPRFRGSNPWVHVLIQHHPADSVVTSTVLGNSRIWRVELDHFGDVVEQPGDVNVSLRKVDPNIWHLQVSRAQAAVDTLISVPHGV